MTPLIHGRDIVVVGQQPWDTALGSNCKDIALEFSRHNRVLYVNSPLDRNTELLVKAPFDLSTITDAALESQQMAARAQIAAYEKGLDS